MKKYLYLIVSVIGNALGTALMANTDLGLTAWGSAAQNFSGLLGISFGTGFIVLATIFYVIAMIIQRKIVLLETGLSFAFLISFGLLSDLFINVIPDMSNLNIVLRILINFLGLAILIFAIALHLKILIAVHPCDIFLYQMQKVFKNDAIGTYFTFFTAFSVTIVSGLLNNEITGIGIGTAFTVLLSGLMIRFYNRVLLKNVI